MIIIRAVIQFLKVRNTFFGAAASKIAIVNSHFILISKYTIHVGDMNLSGQQKKQLQEAIIDAFPTMTSLEQMVSHGLGKNLRAVAGEGSLQDVVFKLIQTADAQGWIKDLVCSACNINPGNLKLQNISKELLPSSNPDIGWKNWKNYPIVVTGSVLTGLAGLISLGYITSISSPYKESKQVNENKISPTSTPSPISTSSQNTQGNNSPVISNSGGSVNLNIDNSTKLEAKAKSEIPKYSGVIEGGKEGKEFTGFISKNDGKIVYLDIRYENANDIYTSGDIEVDSSTKDTKGEFIIVNECDDVLPNTSPVMACGGYSYHVKVPNSSDALYTFSQGAYYLKGYWSVRIFPGIRQGVIDVIISAVDTKDIH